MESKGLVKKLGFYFQFEKVINVTRNPDFERRLRTIPQVGSNIVHRQCH